MRSRCLRHNFCRLNRHRYNLPAVAKPCRRGMVPALHSSVGAPMPPQPRSEPDQAGFDDEPHYHGHRERLRARFRGAGADALSDYELLEMVLFRAIARRDVKPLAKSLIGKFGSFAEVVHAPDARLREISGLGEAAITEIKLIAAAASRVAKGQLKARTMLSSWTDLIDYCRTPMAFADHEQVR